MKLNTNLRGPVLFACSDRPLWGNQSLNKRAFFLHDARSGGMRAKRKKAFFLFHARAEKCTLFFPQRIRNVEKNAPMQCKKGEGFLLNDWLDERRDGESGRGAVSLGSC